jgi:hypothetical protein
VANGVQVLQVPGRGDDAEGHIETDPRYRALVRSVVRWQILGVDQPPNRVQRDAGRGVELEDAEGLFRPVAGSPSERPNDVDHGVAALLGSRRACGGEPPQMIYALIGIDDVDRVVT